MKLNISALLVSLGISVALTACYEDKGNYTYDEIDEIEVTFPETLQAMQGATLSFAPEVVSSINGTIKPDDSNYEYSCLIQYQSKNEYGETTLWTDVNPEHTQAVSFTASYPAATYTMWYIVKDKKTGVERNFKGTLTIKSSTSEGWLVLSNNGAEKRGRLDIIYSDADNNEQVYADIKDETSPEIYNATGIIVVPGASTLGTQIFLTSYSGSYKLNRDVLTTSASEDIRNYEFVTPVIDETIVKYTTIYDNGFTPDTRLCVTAAGNVYGVHSSGGGASLEDPMNTDAKGNPPTYKVAPAIGVSEALGSDCSLYYDITNKRFMGGYYYPTGPADSKILFTLIEPENPKFSFTTGLEFVDMCNSAFSDGDCFTILQDASGKRYVYVINLAGYSRTESFKQSGLYKDITAENFNVADDYAANSQYSFLYYCKDNKVYCYDYAQGIVRDVVTLPAGEKATFLKFNRFSVPRMYSYYIQLNKQDDEEFMALQNELLVGSTTGGEDSGILRFYKITPQGKMEFHKEFKGLGEEIVDVTYRERRVGEV